MKVKTLFRYLNRKILQRKAENIAQTTLKKEMHFQQTKNNQRNSFASNNNKHPSKSQQKAFFSPYYKNNIFKAGFSTIDFMNKLQETEEPTSQNKSETLKKYFQVINFTSELKTHFCFDKFKFAVDFMIENEFLNNQSILKDLEVIFIKNMDRIQTSMRAMMINFLSKKIITELLNFEDKNWVRIFNEFFYNQKSIPIDDFYNSITSIDNLVKHIVAKLSKKVIETSEFPKLYTKFLNRECTKIFNSNVVINSLENIILFSKLVHFKIINMPAISDQVFYNINNVIVCNKNNIILRSGLVLPCILVLHQEIVGTMRTQVVFSEGIKVINDHLFFVYTNYELLENNDKEYLDKFSDNLFYYCFKFMDKKSLEIIFNKLVYSYYNRIKKEDSINWLNEISMLQIISHVLKYHNKDFWELVFSKLRVFLLNDFEDTIKKQLDGKPKSLTYDKDSRFNDKISKRTTNKEQALQNISGLFYIGIIIEIAAAVTLDANHWDFIINSLKRNINFKQKDLFFSIQFIFFYCKEVYSNPRLNQVWKKMIQVFDPKLTRIFDNFTIAEFFVDSIFQFKPVNAENLSNIINRLFLNPVISSKKCATSTQSTEISNQRLDEEDTENVGIHNKDKGCLEENKEITTVSEYAEEEEDIAEEDQNESSIRNSRLITIDINHHTYRDKRSKQNLNKKTTLNANANNTVKSKESAKNSSNISNIELFFFIYELLDPILQQQNNNICLVILGNTFVDLLRYENSFLIGTKIKLFVDKIKVKNLEIFKDTIFKRLKFIIETENVDNPSITKMTVMLLKSGLISELEISRLIYILNKQESNGAYCKMLSSLIENKYKV